MPKKKTTPKTLQVFLPEGTPDILGVILNDGRV
jgi:hypothetical protein